MKLNFHQTSIKFGVAVEAAFCDLHSFARFCDTLQHYPGEQVQGLILRGDVLFKRILFSEVEDVTADEVRQIQDVSPIMTSSDLPFILSHNLFEMTLKGVSFTDRMQKLAELDVFVESLFPDQALYRAFDIVLTGSGGGRPKKDIIESVLPHFVPGVSGRYRYQIQASEQFTQGDISLPMAGATELPEAFQALVHVTREPFALRLTQQENKLILQDQKLQQLSVSLYSDIRTWFTAVLTLLQDKNLLQQPPPSDFARTVPHLGQPRLGGVR